MGLLYIKALHVIFVVSWFAGLFYIVRLFIYHTEAESKPIDEKKILQNQFKIMEKRLWYIITWPAAILATIFGFWMVFQLNLWSSTWMQVKLALILLLWGYHVYTHVLFTGIQNDVLTWSSKQFRLWNELATLWLVSIVFVVVMKNSMDWIYGTVGFFVVGIVLMLGIRLYRQMNQ